MRMRGHSRITRDSGVVGDVDHGGMYDGCISKVARLMT